MTGEFCSRDGAHRQKDFRVRITARVCFPGMDADFEPAIDAQKGREEKMSDCIFSKIANGEIPSNKVYEDEKIMCFHDADPQAPVHVLIIPKKHIESLDAIGEEDKELIGDIMLKIKELAKDLGLENGYRVVNNCGEDGFQTVKHLHFHVLGRRKMTWPPG